MLSARPKTTHADPINKAAIAEKARENFNENHPRSYLCNGLLQLGQKKESIKQAQAKSQKKRNVLRRKAYQTCVRRVEYDIRGCFGGFLVKGGTGKGCL